MSHSRRYIIVTAGRTGSSLLASILADAGADFDMPDRDSWNPKRGAYEHPLLLQAYAWYSRADKLNQSLVPNGLGWKWLQTRMRLRLDSLMRHVNYAKYPGGGVWMVQSIANLGYDVRVIVNYRRFEDYARSRYLRFGWGIQRIMNTYLNVYGTALMQLEYFGGCAVDFDEIVDPNETAWLSTISGLTGLDEASLLHAQSQRVRLRSSQTDTAQIYNPIVDNDRVTELYDAMRSLKGQLITP